MRSQEPTRCVGSLNRKIQICRHAYLSREGSAPEQKKFGRSQWRLPNRLCSSLVANNIGCRFGYDYFLPTVFFLAGFLAAAFFTGAFLAADFFLAGIRFPPFPLATAKIGENHVNNSLLAVNSSLRKRRQRIFFDFRLIFFVACVGSLDGPCPRSKVSSAFATMSSTFHRRPRPSYPQASIPSSGPMKIAPRALELRHFLGWPDAATSCHSSLARRAPAPAWRARSR